MVNRSLAIIFVWLFAFPAHAVYMYAEPPSGWRPGSDYSDGHARLIMGTVGGGGALNQGAPASYLTPNSPNVHPIIAQRESIYSDPVVDWIWRHMPGGDAHAFVPAAVYGAGVVVTTVVRSGASRAAIPGFLKFAGHAGKDAARQGFAGGGTAAGRQLWKTMILTAGLNWVWDEALRAWTMPDPDASESDGLEYSYGDGWHPTIQTACNALGVSWIAQFQAQPSYAEHEGPILTGQECKARWRSSSGGWQPWFRVLQPDKRGSACPAGWYWTPAGCLASINNRPLTLEQFETGLQGQPWPDQLPEHLPDGVPVMDPVINPLPSPWDRPQPYFWPIGDPVKNPQFDPSKEPSKANPPMLQPGRRVTGSPAPGEPL